MIGCENVSTSDEQTRVVEEDAVRTDRLKHVPEASPVLLRIEADRPNAHYWVDLIRYRELFLFLAWRDILVRYKQTVIGIAWAVIRPLLTMMIFTLVFGSIARLDGGGVPYPVLVMCALLPWQLFANALTEASASLIANSNLVTKVYFPRMIMPAAAITVAVVDFLIAFVLLLGMMAIYSVVPSWKVIFLPLFVVQAILCSLGAGLLITALNVRYRDVRYIIPFIVQLGLYLSPVGFRSDVVPEQWRMLYALNPIVGIIDGFRWSLLGNSTLNPVSILLSVVVTAVVLMLGISYFRRTERSFADLI